MTSRRTLGIAGALVGTSVVAVLWFLFAPTAVGGSVRYAVVDGASMEPHLHRGDLAILAAGGPYRVGEVAGYHNAELGRVVLHRIVGRAGARYRFKGDNNGFVDTAEPTGDQLVGRLWLRVPRAGGALVWLRRPRHAGIVGGLAALLVVPGGGAATRRKRRRRDKPAGDGGGLVVGSAVLWSCVVAAACFGLLALIGYTHPTSQAVSTPAGYVHEGRFAYRAPAVAGGVYPTGEVRTGETVFSRLVRRLSVRFSYRFASALPTAVSGRAGLTATLTSNLGWRRTIAVARPRRFHGDAVRVSTELDLDALERQIERYFRVTGVPSDTFQVLVSPHVHVRGVVGGESIAATFAPPPLTFAIDQYSLRLTQSAVGSPAPGQPAADPLRPTSVGSVQRSLQRRLALPGLHPRITTVRRVATVGGLGALVAALAAAAFCSTRRGRGELSRILHRYGDAIVTVQSGSAAPDGDCVDVASFASLVQMADHCGRLILHRNDDERHTFYFGAEGTTYRYRLTEPQTSRRRSPVRAVGQHAR